MIKKIITLLFIIYASFAFAELQDGQEETALANTGAMDVDVMFETKLPIGDFFDSLANGEAETTIMTNATIDLAAHYLIDHFYMGGDAEFNELNILAVLAMFGGGVSPAFLAPNDISLSLQAGYCIIRKADQVIAVAGSIDYNPEFTDNGVYHNIGGGVVLNGIFPVVKGTIIGVKLLGVINEADDSIVAPVLKIGTDLKWYLVNNDDSLITLNTKFDVIKDYANNWGAQLDVELLFGKNANFQGLVGLETDFSTQTRLKAGIRLSGAQLAKIIGSLTGSH